MKERPRYAMTHSFQKAGSMAQALTGEGVDIFLTLRNVTSLPYATQDTYCGKENNAMYLALGVDQSGTDTKSLVKIRLLNSTAPRNKMTPRDPKKRDPGPRPRNEGGNPQQGVTTFNLDTLGTVDSILMLTNGPSDNQWLRWIIASAQV